MSPVQVRSLKSIKLCSTSLQMDKTFCGVVGAAVEQSRRKAFLWYLQEYTRIR